MPRSFLPPGFDYYAGGHIHTRIEARDPGRARPPRVPGPPAGPPVRRPRARPRQPAGLLHRDRGRDRDRPLLRRGPAPARGPPRPPGRRAHRGRGRPRARGGGRLAFARGRDRACPGPGEARGRRSPRGPVRGGPRGARRPGRALRQARAGAGSPGRRHGAAGATAHGSSTRSRRGFSPSDARTSTPTRSSTRWSGNGSRPRSRPKPAPRRGGGPSRRSRSEPAEGEAGRAFADRVRERAGAALPGLEEGRVRLVRLALSNIRSYGPEPTVVEFGDGITLFWGEIGSGKSTLLAALEFGLFGLGDIKNTHLLRHRAARGEVAVTFSAGETEYTVHRALVRGARKGDVRQVEGRIEVDGERTDYSTTELKARVLEPARVQRAARPEGGLAHLPLCRVHAAGGDEAGPPARARGTARHTPPRLRPRAVPLRPPERRGAPGPGRDRAPARGLRRRDPGPARDRGGGAVARRPRRSPDGRAGGGLDGNRPDRGRARPARGSGRAVRRSPGRLRPRPGRTGGAREGDRRRRGRSGCAPKRARPDRGSGRRCRRREPVRGARRELRPVGGAGCRTVPPPRGRSRAPGPGRGGAGPRGSDRAGAGAARGAAGGAQGPDSRRETPAPSWPRSRPRRPASRRRSRGSRPRSLPRPR